MVFLFIDLIIDVGFDVIERVDDGSELERANLSDPRLLLRLLCFTTLVHELEHNVLGLTSASELRQTL